MTTWHVQLLGGFDIRRNGVSLNGAFQTDSARILFAWLCFHQKQAVRRETLATLLWSDKPQSAAQNALRVTLSRIRQAIGLNTLLTDPTTVTLNLSSDWHIDALEFLRAVTTVRNHPHRSVAGCPICQAHLHRAAMLYRGSLLAGMTPESEPLLAWITHQSETMHRAAIEVYGHLAEYALRVGDWRAAQDYAGRQLQLEPWYEAAHRQLMVAFARQGQRTAALAQYQNCCDLLQHEFGIEPEDETKQLAESIRTGQLAHFIEPILPSQHQADAINRLPLIGREREVATLIDWLNQAGLQLITIIGAGGIGKTRLALRAAHLMQYAFRDGARYIFLHPEDGAAMTNDDATASLARAIAIACHIEVNDHYPLPAQIIAALQSRAYLLVCDSFEHVAAANLFVNELLTAAPDCVVLVTSRQPLHLRREQILKLGPLSTKTTTAEPSPSAQMFIALAQRSGVTGEGQLALADIEHICADLDGMPLGIELAAAALHTMNLPDLRHIMQQRIQTFHNPLADAPARHRSLSAILASTWQTLTATSRQALAMLSVVHAPCPLAAAQAIIGSEEALAELFDLALARRLDDGTVWLHEHVRQWAGERLLSNFDPTIADTAHRRHAEWFLDWLAGAYHAMQGTDSFVIRERLLASSKDIEAAWYWALIHGVWDRVSAAVPAYEVLFYLSGRFVDGLERFQQSLAYVSQPGQPETKRLRVRLLIGQATLQRLRSSGPASEAMLQEAVTLAEQLADRQLLANALLRLGTLQNTGRYNASGRATLDRLREVLDQQITMPPNELYVMESAYWRLMSWLELHAGRNEMAIAYAQQARELAEQAHQYVMIAHCYESLSAVFSTIGNFADSEHYLQQALTIYQQLRLTYHQTNVLDLLAQNADARGDYEQAQRYYWQELVLARECGNLDAELVAHINLGISYDQMGHYEQALTHTQIAMALCDKVGNTKHHTVILANLSLHAHHNHRHELALAYARSATEQAANLPDLRAYGYDFQGHALLALGRLDEAEQAYHQAKTIRQQINYPVLVLESQAGLTRVALTRNDAAEALRRAIPIVEHLLAGGHLYGTEETVRIYWTAYQALAANQDPRAETILALGQSLVRERADRLSDLTKRTIFLNAEINRQIMVAGQTAAARHPTAA